MKEKRDKCAEVLLRKLKQERLEGQNQKTGPKESETPVGLRNSDESALFRQAAEVLSAVRRSAQRAPSARRTAPTTGLHTLRTCALAESQANRIGPHHAPATAPGPSGSPARPPGASASRGLLGLPGRICRPPRAPRRCSAPGT